MRHALAAAAFALITGAALFAQDQKTDDWKWDPRNHKKKPVAGQHTSYSGFDGALQKVRVSQGGKTVKNENERRRLCVRYDSEVVSVDGRKITEQVHHVKSFLLVTEGAPPDASLEGVDVRVKGTGDERTTTLEGERASKVSDAAKKWAESELGKKGKKKKKADDEDEDENPFIPEKPVAPESEWDLDPKVFAEKLAGNLGACDLERSKGKGKLTNVHLVDGVHYGTVEITLKLQTKKVMGTTSDWTDGGAFRVTVRFDGSLEEDKVVDTAASMTMTFKGEGTVKSPSGDADLSFEMLNEKAEREATRR
jgi:hypothetical protein